MRPLSRIDGDLINYLEHLTREGKARQVAQSLAKFSLQKVPRTYAAQLGQLCVRNGLFLTCIKILTSIIQAQRELGVPPKPSEIISYANSLIQLGFSKEARNLLKSIDLKQEPEALLILSFSYFNEWNYQRSIPFLNRFINAPNISNYRRTVGLVNLAAAYIQCGFLHQAENLITRNLPNLDDSMKLLRGNCFELLAQIKILRNNYREALGHLKEAQSLLPDSASIYSFFVQKWTVICELLLNPQNKEKLSSCEELKNEAKKWKNWETLRDLDLYVAYATNDLELQNKILLGTKNPYFIKKMESLFGKKIKPPKNFFLQGDNFSTSKITVEFSSLILHLEKKPLLAKLFKFFIEDFYRPATLGNIFNKLYPKEYFNPLSSEKRVTNQVYLLKKELNKIGSKINIKKVNMNFILEIPHDTRILLNRTAHRLRTFPTLKERIKKWRGGKYFSCYEFANFISCSRRKAQYTLNKLLVEGYLTKVGQGPRTFYIISSYREDSKQTSETKQAG